MLPARLCVTCRCLVVAIAAASTTGCSATRVTRPSEREYAAVRGGRAAVVMLRVTEEVPGGGLRSAIGPRVPGQGKRVSLARLDAGRAVKTVGPLRSPADGALRRGWLYLVLKPGTYYLLVHDPVLHGQRSGYPPETPLPDEHWLLEVPTGSPLVYAGTIVNPITAAPDRGGARPAGAAGITTARDESPEARDLTSKHFRDLGGGLRDGLRSMVVRRYGGPVTLPAGSAGLPSPRVFTQGAPRPTGFDVRGTCVQDGAWYGLLWGEPILSTAGSSSNSPADLFLFMVKTGLYIWAGTGATIGSIVGIGEAREIQPCVAQTVQWAGQYDLAAKLSESLSGRSDSARDGADGSDARTAGGSRVGDERQPTLNVSVQELHLRPCTKAHLACVEAKVRVRLWDPRAGRHEMDRVLLYSNGAARHRTEPYGATPPSYVLPVDESPVLNLRALRRMPVAERRATIEAEMDRAVEVISRYIVADLGPPHPAIQRSAEQPQAASWPAMEPPPSPTLAEQPRPIVTTLPTPARQRSVPPAATRPATTRPLTTRPSPAPAERGSPDAAASACLDAFERHDAELLSRVIVPGEIRSPADNARLALVGKGSLAGVDQVLKSAGKVWVGQLEQAPPLDGAPRVRVHLLRKGKRGDDRSVGSFEVVHENDGWRVSEWDMPH